MSRVVVHELLTVRDETRCGRRSIDVPNVTTAEHEVTCKSCIGRLAFKQKQITDESHEFEVETGIPVPRCYPVKKVSTTEKLRQVMDSMDVGESVKIPWALRHTYRHLVMKSSAGFKSRRLKNEDLRFWKTERYKK